jgi:hypothetical protein
MEVTTTTTSPTEQSEEKPKDEEKKNSLETQVGIGTSYTQDSENEIEEEDNERTQEESTTQSLYAPRLLFDLTYEHPFGSDDTPWISSFRFRGELGPGFFWHDSVENEINLDSNTSEEEQSPTTYEARNSFELRPSLEAHRKDKLFKASIAGLVNHNDVQKPDKQRTRLKLDAKTDWDQIFETGFRLRSSLRFDQKSYNPPEDNDPQRYYLRYGYRIAPDYDFGIVELETEYLYDDQEKITSSRDWNKQVQEFDFLADITTPQEADLLIGFDIREQDKTKIKVNEGVQGDSSIEQIRSFGPEIGFDISRGCTKEDSADNADSANSTDNADKANQPTEDCKETFKREHTMYFAGRYNEVTGYQNGPYPSLGISYNTDISIKKFELQLKSSLYYAWGEVEYGDLRYYGVHEPILGKHPFNLVEGNIELEHTYSPHENLSFEANISAEFYAQSWLFREIEFTGSAEIATTITIPTKQHKIIIKPYAEINMENARSMAEYFYDSKESGFGLGLKLLVTDNFEWKQTRSAHYVDPLADVSNEAGSSERL